MIQKIEGTPPPPIPPDSPQGSQPTGFQGAGQEQGFMAAWSQMFGGKASKEELAKIMAGVLKDAIDQIKKEQQKAVEAIKKMRQDQEEGLS